MTRKLKTSTVVVVVLALLGTWGALPQVHSGKESPNSISGCGPCDDRERCASPVQCLAGYMPDPCGCCQICARTERELCDMSLNERVYGICGDNLECRSRKISDETTENACFCKEDKMVCSNEDRTYPTICSLNEEAMARGKHNPQLAIKYWGPCKEAPVIISGPEDSYGPLGANMTLDCEARGYPAPTITWQFVSSEGKSVSLPSDDQSVSIQMRGGPEPLMVTGWMQIMKLEPKYIGAYHCIATNSEGQVYSMATVGVYKNEEL